MPTHLSSTRPTTHSSRARALAAGLGAGAVAAVVASLVSLALRSPDRVLINSASVSIAALLAGLVTGLVYDAGVRRGAEVRALAIWVGGAFIVVAAAGLALEAAPGHPLPHVATFCIPLAAIALVLVGLLTPLLARLAPRALWLALPAGAAALVLGISLAAHSGSGANGRLSLASAAARPAGSAAGGGLLHPQDVAGLAFVVDPAQSKATYTVHERLADLPAPSDAVGTTSQVSGTIYLDGRLSTVSVDMRSFKSDDPGRDQHLLRDPGLANYAPAQFTVANLDLPASYRPGDTVTRQIQGTMTLNNVEKPLTFAVEARLQDNTLSIHGATDFTFADFNIPKPTFTRVLNIDDKIHAEVLLVARPQS